MGVLSLQLYFKSSYSSFQLNKQHITNSMGACLASTDPPRSQELTTSKFQPGSQQYQDEILFGNALLGFVEKSDMTKVPHKHVVAIIWRNHENEVGRGSGVLVSGNVVITCAHNLYHRTVPVHESWLEIYVAPWGELGKFYKVEKYYVNNRFGECSKENSILYEYALIKLSQRVNTTDFIPLKLYDNMEFGEFAVYGYSRSSYEGLSNNKQSAKQRGRSEKKCLVEVRIQKNQILHRVSTQQGQSGSPIIEIQGGRMFMIGIHKGGLKIKNGDGEYKEFNSGRLITTDMVVDLKEATRQLGGDMFILEGESNLQQKNQASPTYLPSPAKLATKESFNQEKRKQAKLEPPKVVSNRPTLQSQILDQDPEFHQIRSTEEWYILGDGYYDKKQFRRARRCYQKILQQNQKDGKAYYNLGLTFEGDGMVEHAIKSYRRAIAFDPKNYEAHYNLGCMYEQSKQLFDARREFMECQKLFPGHLNSKIKLEKINV